MILSTTIRRLHLQPSNMHMYFAVPRENLAGYVIERTSSLVIDLNVICTTINYVVQNIILLLKIGYSINEYPKILDWITFAAAMAACIGTVASLIENKNRPPNRGRWLNFYVALVLVGLIGPCVHIDPRVFTVAIVIMSSVLLSVTKAKSQRKERWFLWGARRIPIAIMRIEDEVITDLRVSEKHAHLVDSLYQAGRVVAFSVRSSGEGVMTEWKMKEE